MFKHLGVLVVISFSIVWGCAQQRTPNYEGNWVGTLTDKQSFNFKVRLKVLDNDHYQLVIANNKVLIDKSVKSTDEERIQFKLDDALSFDLYKEQNGQALAGFIKSGRFIYSVRMPKVATDTFEGPWNSFMFNDDIISDDFLLFAEYLDNDQLAAYPIFGDQRFRGAWSGGFEKRNDTLYFEDTNTGFHFRAALSPTEIGLGIYIADALITKIDLTHSVEDLVFQTDSVPNDQSTITPAKLNDGWETVSIQEMGVENNHLERLIADVQNKKLVNTHSVLLAKEGKLIFETYFDGFNVNIPHDLRSASKSISSAVIGIAVEEGILEGVDGKLYDCIPTDYQYTKDAEKFEIRLKDLLTMSSGLDVNNQASENFYQNPENPGSWLKKVLEAPMVHTPGTYADYGSANPFLLGICLNERLQTPLEKYMHDKLFAPLGITNYVNQTDERGDIPYFGGGMMLTSRDLLKFGQLYLNKGTWKGKRIISEDWVSKSFEKYVRLQDYTDKNEYGYLWWHDSYEVDGKIINTVEARGAGGQFIFILPELESVVVITSGNFRNRKGNQPRDILRDYLLPAMLP